MMAANQRPTLSKHMVTSPHSGHFATSNLNDDDDYLEDGLGLVLAGLGVEGPGFNQLQHRDHHESLHTPSIEFVRSAATNSYQLGTLVIDNLQAAKPEIDNSLTKLFACMNIAYSKQLAAPKFKAFKGLKISIRERLRLNNIIWREWHMQYVKHVPRKISWFSAAMDESKPKVVVLEGKYWKRRSEVVCAEYRKWRVFYKARLKPKLKDNLGLGIDELLERAAHHDRPAYAQNTGIITTRLHPGHYDHESLHMYYSDHVFATLQQFSDPSNRDFNGLDNADFVQPSLSGFELDEFATMDTFDPLQDLLVEAFHLPPDFIKPETKPASSNSCDISDFEWSSLNMLPALPQPFSSNSSNHQPPLTTYKTATEMSSFSAGSNQFTASKPSSADNYAPTILDRNAAQLTSDAFDVVNPAVRSLPRVQPQLATPQKECSFTVPMVAPYESSRVNHINGLAQSAQPSSIPENRGVPGAPPAAIASGSSLSVLVNLLKGSLPSRPLTETGTSSGAQQGASCGSKMIVVQKTEPVPRRSSFSQPAARSARNSLDTEVMNTSLSGEEFGEERRESQPTSEQKRRSQIKNGFDALAGLVPTLSNNANSKVSKAAILQKTCEFVTKLKGDRQQMQAEAEALQRQIEALNLEIRACQGQLPATGIPISRQHSDQMKRMHDTYVHNHIMRNWKFYVFNQLTEPLFNSFNNLVSTVSVDELYRSTQAWLDQHCNLPALRPGVLQSLMDICAKTSILTDPSKFPEQARQSIAKEPSGSSR